MKIFIEKSGEFFNYVIDILKERKFEKYDELSVRRDELINMANDILKNRIKILKKTQKGVKVSVTYMEMLSETKNLFLNVVQLVKTEALLQDTISLSGMVDIDRKMLD